MRRGDPEVAILLYITTPGVSRARSALRFAKIDWANEIHACMVHFHVRTRCCGITAPSLAADRDLRPVHAPLWQSRRAHLAISPLRFSASTPKHPPPPVTNCCACHS